MIFQSYVEYLGVTRLDGLALFFDRGGVIFHGLDILQRLAAGLVLRIGVHRAQASDIDDELLRLATEAERLKQLGGVWIGRVLEDAVRADDQRRTFGRIDRLDRAAPLLQ